MIGLELNKKNLKILCLGAHSDDIEIGCGGSLLKLLNEKQFDQIEWVVFTCNKEREHEAKNSANMYLENQSNFNISILNFRDGYLPNQYLEIKEEFEKIKQRINPDLIFTHYRDDRHQDHRLISDLTWNTFRNHLILEYEIPKWDGDLGIPNFFVELPEDLMSKKIELLMDCFRSQIGKHWFDEGTFSSLLRLRGLESASKYAEAFYARKVKIF